MDEKEITPDSLERENAKAIEDAENGQPHSDPPCFCVHFLKGHCALAERNNAQVERISADNPCLSPLSRVPTECSYNPLCPNRAETPDEIIMLQQARPSYKKVLNSSSYKEALEKLFTPKTFEESLKRAFDPQVHLKHLSDKYGIDIPTKIGPFDNLSVSITFEEIQGHQVPQINLSGTF